MSDQSETTQLWEAPFFEQPAAPDSQAASAQLEVLAQARGFQMGKQEGLESGRAEAEEMVKSMTALIEQMAHPFRGLDEVVTRELAQVAMLLAQQIVRRELTVNSDIVTNIVAEALSTLYKLEGEIVIFLNGADVDLVAELAPESLEGKTWKIVEDSALFPGGCQVKTPTSFVDASVEKQMEVVFENLIESCEQGLDS